MLLRLLAVAGRSGFICVVLACHARFHMSRRAALPLLALLVVASWLPGRSETVRRKLSDQTRSSRPQQQDQQQSTSFQEEEDTGAYSYYIEEEGGLQEELSLETVYLTELKDAVNSHDLIQQLANSEVIEGSGEEIDRARESVEGSSRSTSDELKTKTHIFTIDLEELDLRDPEAIFKAVRTKAAQIQDKDGGNSMDSSTSTREGTEGNLELDSSTLQEGDLAVPSSGRNAMKEGALDENVDLEWLSKKDDTQLEAWSVSNEEQDVFGVLTDLFRQLGAVEVETNELLDAGSEVEVGEEYVAPGYPEDTGNDLAGIFGAETLKGNDRLEFNASFGQGLNYETPKHSQHLCRIEGFRRSCGSHRRT